MPTVTLLAIEDAEIRESAPDTNFGTATTIIVQSQTKNMRALIKFNISTLLGKSIQGAELRCIASYSNPMDNYHRDHLIRRTTGIWSETGVTWNNKPVVSDLNSNVSHHDYLGGTETEIYPVAAMLQDAVNEGKTELGLMIQDNVEYATSLNYLEYYAKERGSPPQLVVTYTEAPPPTHTISINSSPVTGVPVNLDASSIGNTPVAQSVLEGTHTVSVPSEVQT